jgi:hypothetical protein
MAVEARLPLGDAEGCGASGAAAGQEKAPPVFRRPLRVEGRRLRFREAAAGDAPFILQLRLDPSYGRHLSPTADDPGAQQAYIERCRIDPKQIYFVIERLDGRPVGTVRLYDVRGGSFGWGSWILTDEKPAYAAIETTLLVFHYAFACGFTASHGEVRKTNQAVWRFHEHYGGIRIGEDAGNYHYALGRAGIERMVKRYARILPSPRIELCP